jgi:hypothetical protein
LIWGEREAEYFCARGWTEKSITQVICPSGASLRVGRLRFKPREQSSRIKDIDARLRSLYALAMTDDREQKPRIVPGHVEAKIHIGVLGVLEDRAELLSAIAAVRQSQVQEIATPLRLYHAIVWLSASSPQTERCSVFAQNDEHAREMLRSQFGEIGGLILTDVAADSRPR